jgi:colanic acid/amylovoran biosynthesis glycosyltransferase
LPEGLPYRNRIMPDVDAARRPAVLVYTEPLLARSMTFVRSQAEALESYSPYYVGPHSLQDGLQLPKERVIVQHRGKGSLLRIAEVPLKTVGFAPLFVRRLRKLRPVLLHAHFGPMGLRALPLAQKLGIPLVVTFHGYDATIRDDLARKSGHYSLRAYVRHRKELERSASLLIAVSNFIRSELARQGFAEEKVVVHYIGVDTEHFRPDPDVRREPMVLFTGRLAEKKGCEYLIRAMAKVQSAFPATELVIIGDGPLRAELEREAGQALRRYRFLGFQPPDVVRHWMNRARVFAAPSVRAQSGDSEGYPIAYAEAQAMCLPVVSFVSGGVPEAVLDGETGLLAPERDVEALALNLQKLVSNESLCLRMGEAARKRVMAHFDLRIQTKKLEEHYLRVLGERVDRSLPRIFAEGKGFGRVSAVGSQGR